MGMHLAARRTLELGGGAANHFLTISVHRYLSRPFLTEKSKFAKETSWSKETQHRLPHSWLWKVASRCQQTSVGLELISVKTQHGIAALILP